MKMNKVLQNVKQRLCGILVKVCCRVRQGLSVEHADFGGKEVIVEFVLMVVAVAVGYIFRDELKTLVTSLGTSVSSKITTMFNAS